MRNGGEISDMVYRVIMGRLFGHDLIRLAMIPLVAASLVALMTAGILAFEYRSTGHWSLSSPSLQTYDLQLSDAIFEEDASFTGAVSLDEDGQAPVTKTSQ